MYIISLESFNTHSAAPFYSNTNQKSYGNIVVYLHNLTLTKFNKACLQWWHHWQIWQWWNVLKFHQVDTASDDAVLAKTVTGTSTIVFMIHKYPVYELFSIRYLSLITKEMGPFQYQDCPSGYRNSYHKDSSCNHVIFTLEFPNWYDSIFIFMGCWGLFRLLKQSPALNELTPRHETPWELGKLVLENTVVPPLFPNVSTTQEHT